ncbi:MAG: hypothetical protein KI788_06320 [Mameliella sp.]|nr:hypothetical protein [Mameliella sp.]
MAEATGRFHSSRLGFGRLKSGGLGRTPGWFLANPLSAYTLAGGDEPIVVLDYDRGIYYAGGQFYSTPSFVTYAGAAVNATGASGETIAYGVDEQPVGHHMQDSEGNWKPVGMAWDAAGNSQSLEIPFALISPAIGAEAISVVMECAADYIDTVEADIQFWRWREDGDNQLVAQEASTGTAQFLHEQAATVQTAGITAKFFSGTTGYPYTVAMRATASAVQGAIDGELTTETATAGFPVITSAGLQIGRILSGSIRKVVVYASDIGENGLRKASVGDFPSVFASGDSFIQGTQVENELRALFKEDRKWGCVKFDGVGGSTLAQQLGRQESAPEYWDHTLIIGDFGRTDSSANAITAVQDMAALLSHNRWIHMQPAPNPPDRMSPLFLITDFPNDPNVNEVGSSFSLPTTVNGQDCHEFIEDSSTGTHLMRIQHSPQGGPMVLCLKALGNTRSWLRVVVRDETGASRFCNFDVTNGAIGSKSSGGSGIKTGIHQLGAGNGSFYRCILYVPSTESSGTQYVDISLANADNSTSYTGDGASSVYVSEASFYDPSQLLLADDIAMRDAIGANRFVSTLEEAQAYADLLEADDVTAVAMGMWPVLGTYGSQTFRQANNDFHPGNPDGDKFIAARMYAGLKQNGWA